MTRPELLDAIAALPLKPDTADEARRFLATVPDDELPRLSAGGPDNFVMFLFDRPEQRTLCVSFGGPMLVPAA